MGKAAVHCSGWRPLLALAVTALHLGSCSVAQAQSSSCDSNCPNTNKPVCANGKKFSSECHARCAGYLTLTPTQNGNCNMAPTPTTTDGSHLAQVDQGTAAG